MLISSAVSVASAGRGLVERQLLGQQVRALREHPADGDADDRRGRGEAGDGSSAASTPAPSVTAPMIAETITMTSPPPEVSPS